MRDNRNMRKMNFCKSVVFNSVQLVQINMKTLMGVSKQSSNYGQIRLMASLLDTNTSINTNLVIIITFSSVTYYILRANRLFRYN